MSATTVLECPACGRTQWARDLKAGAHQLIRCACGLKALDRDSSFNALEDNESMYGADEYNEFYRSVKDQLIERFQNDLNEIEQMTNNKGSILDIGCSYGWFLGVARGRGWSTIGIEATDATASEARNEGLDVRTGLLEQQGFPEAFFDVVCLWDVLEHIPNIDSFLAECHRVLKPGGILAVQSPNIQSVVAQEAKSEWAWLLLPQHVWHFTPSTMRAVLLQRGFNVERLRTWEPAEALMASLYRNRPLLGSRNVRRVTDKLLVPASKAWARLGKGGLIRAYARRSA